MTVERAMVRQPLAVPADAPLGMVYGTMRSRVAHEALVMPSSWRDAFPPIRPIGILTVRDALAAAAQQVNWRDCPVVRFMVHPVLTVSANDELDHAVALMDALGVHRLPVVSHGALVGLLTSESILRARAEQLRALEKRLEQREQEALQDPLTALPNRRLFQEVLEREFQLHRRNHVPLALLLLDVDLFKEVNDTFGHPAGDVVLRQIAVRLQQAVRRADLLARVGGEEFAVLAAVDERSHAAALGEKLRNAVASEPFVIPAAAVAGPMGQDDDGSSGHARSLDITASIGAALTSPRLIGSEDLIRQADAALYVAKRCGRNAVRVA